VGKTFVDKLPRFMFLGGKTYVLKTIKIRLEACSLARLSRRVETHFIVFYIPEGGKLKDYFLAGYRDLFVRDSTFQFDVQRNGSSYKLSFSLTAGEKGCLSYVIVYWNGIGDYSPTFSITQYISEENEEMCIVREDDSFVLFPNPNEEGVVIFRAKQLVEDQKARKAIIRMFS